MCCRSIVFVFFLLLSRSVCTQTKSQISHNGGAPFSSEIFLKDAQLVSTEIEKPQPVGMVDENPPWLHVNIPILDGSETSNSAKKAKLDRLKFKRQFYFKLSQDSTFKDGVFESGPKRWAFYNTYEHLKTGKWFWIYGVADPETPHLPKWHSEVFSFIISGKERLTPIPPKPDDFCSAVVSRAAPVFQIFREEFGRLLPVNTWPEMADWGGVYFRKKLDEDMPMSYDVSDQDAIDKNYVDDNGKITAQKIFYRQVMNDKLTLRKRYINDLVAGYLLLGEKEFIHMAIDKCRDLLSFYKTGSFYINSLNETLVLRNEVWDTPYELKNFIDICPEVLTEAEKKEITNDVYSPDWMWPKDFEYAEHVVFDQHMWQQFLDKLKDPLIFARESEKAREELKYAYELWLYRAPALSRTDGGSLEGDGYLGVHDSYLATIPWLIYKLTGYNFFTSHPWFSNHGKYLTYINPFGTAGNAFCDGDTDGATMPYLMEMMAYMVPQNYWNLWRFRTIGRRPYKNFTADLGKKDIALALLSLWSQIPAPDMLNLKPPAELASYFPDVGEVGMHTDLGNMANNLHVVMHSSPYGSTTHLHPCQNAFNIAFGGQDLFWKTGYYNGGEWHNQLSYKNSRAHNTIMADGLVQGFHRSAYGWMPRFVHGDRISYALGDASNAYNDQNNYKSDKYKDANGNFLLANVVPYTKEYGFGNPGVTKFRRHIVMLRPSHVLIYDELEAEKPITWEFRLHSRRYMKQLGDAWLMGKNDFAVASAKMFCQAAVNTTLKFEYLKNEREPGYVKPAPGDAWLMRPIDDENKLPKPIPQHYHGAFSTQGRFSKMRFLTVIEIFPGKDISFVPNELTATGDDLITVHIGDFTVMAQLNGEKPSFLSVKNMEGSVAFVTGTAAESVTLGGQTKKAQLSGSTILFEKNTFKGDIFIEAVDKLPDALVFGNTY